MENYVLKSESLTIHFINYGATITHVYIKDKDGIIRDVVLGFDDPKMYSSVASAQNPYFGCIAGRTCNRTKDGKLILNNTNLQLPLNNGPNSLHGGISGFDKKYWKTELYDPSNCVLIFSLFSDSGDEGYPGAINTIVKYTLVSDSLTIEYETSWANVPGNDNFTETVINLTNHSYFNLSGLSNETIKNHYCVFPNVNGYLELDHSQIPTGKIIPIKHSKNSFDFTLEKSFGQDLDKVDEFKGYDHFFLIENQGLNIPAVIVTCRETGISLKLYTDALGFQLYTGNWLDGSLAGKRSQSVVYGQYSGFCLEASAPPNSINDLQWRDLVLLKKGDISKRKDVYCFNVSL